MPTGNHFNFFEDLVNAALFLKYRNNICNIKECIARKKDIVDYWNKNKLNCIFLWCNVFIWILKLQMKKIHKWAFK